MINPNDLSRYYERKPILITGGLGFLGSNLAHALVALGAKVTLLDPLFPQYGGNLFNIEEIADRVAVVREDIRNQSILDLLIPEHELIFHIAAQTSHVDSLKEPFYDLDINCKGTLMILETIRARAPKAKI